MGQGPGANMRLLLQRLSDGGWHSVVPEGASRAEASALRQSAHRLADRGLASLRLRKGRLEGRLAGAGGVRAVDAARAEGERLAALHDAILELRDEGRTQKAIAAALGCAQSTVSRTLRLAGRPTYNVPPADADMAWRESADLPPKLRSRRVRRAEEGIARAVAELDVAVGIVEDMARRGDLSSIAAQRFVSALDAARAERLTARLSAALGRADVCRMMDARTRR